MPRRAKGYISFALCSFMGALVGCLLFPSIATALFRVGVLDTPGIADDVEIMGAAAYVADRASGLRVIIGR